MKSGSKESQPRILLVEDESGIADNVVYALSTDGFETKWVSTGGDALTALEETTFSLIILDIGLPDTNGFELCRQIRRDSSVPIIFLTARSDEIDRVVGLEIGADDYVTKPFSPRELSARARAVLRRTVTIPVVGGSDPTGKGSCAEIADDQDEGHVFRIDESSKAISYFNSALTLSLYEFKILRALMKSPGRVFSRSELLNHACDEPEFSTERTIDTHIKTIRNKLRAIRDNIDPIETRRGFGYALRIPE